jgi:hypothetical protein
MFFTAFYEIIFIKKWIMKNLESFFNLLKAFFHKTRKFKYCFHGCFLCRIFLKFSFQKTNVGRLLGTLKVFQN